MNNIRNQYQGKLAKAYDDSRHYDHPHQFLAYQTWLETLGSVRGKRVLDLACGAGVSTRMLSARGAQVLGVDISDELLSSARSNEKSSPQGNKYVSGDASNVTLYSEEKFNRVTGAFLLHYAQSREMLGGFVQNIAKNLAPQGTFVGIQLSPDHPIVLPQKGISHSSRWLGAPWEDGSAIEVTLYSNDDKPTCTFTDYYWSKKAYEEVFAKSGMCVIEWKEIVGSKPTDNMLVVIRAVKI